MQALYGVWTVHPTLSGWWLSHLPSCLGSVNEKGWLSPSSWLAFSIFVIGQCVGMQDVFVVFGFSDFLCFFSFLKEKESNKEIGKGYSTGPHCQLLAAVDCSGSTTMVVETATTCVAVDPSHLLGSRVLCL